MRDVNAGAVDGCGSDGGERTPPLPVVRPGEQIDDVRRAMDASGVGAAEIPRPPLDALPYRDFVRAILAAPGLRLDFGGQAPAAVLDMVAAQLLGRGAFAAERAAFARDIERLADFVRAVVDAPRAQITLRSCFLPGDTVWHLDRMAEARAVRLVWPIGRAHGMRLVPRDAVDAVVFAGFMRREHVLLGQLDTAVMRSGADPSMLWRHRPRQLAAMRSGDFPFLRDRAREVAVSPGAASVHRVDTPDQPGSYHRSCWENRTAPGLQLVVTAAAS